MKLSLALAGLVVAKDDGDRKFGNNAKFMDAATKSWWFDASWDAQRRLDSISERWLRAAPDHQPPARNA